MSMTCPQCVVEMKEVKAAALTGYLLALDQCSRCGGIWSDRWEVFPLSAEAVARLDNVDVAALQAPVSAAPAVLECPRCRARLRRFADPALPPGARIERCPNCEGMWFNRGELRRFKSQHDTHAPVKNDIELDRLARAATTPDELPTVRNLDAAMHAAEDQHHDDLRGEIAASAAWVVVRAILRLLLHV